MASARTSPRTSIFRFKPGDKVWVRDRRARGFAVVAAIVREQHKHLNRQPAYPRGEGYALDGELWWDCYPGCRVFRTRAQAQAARISNYNTRYIV